jgi:hypothetical protein
MIIKDDPIRVFLSHADRGMRVAEQETTAAAAAAGGGTPRFQDIRDVLELPINDFESISSFHRVYR